MIEHYSAGLNRIKGINYNEDVKIIQGEVVPHWWRKSGHRLKAEDIRDVLDAHPDILVVGTGFAENLHISQNLVSLANAKNLQLIAENTANAVKTFNRLHSEGSPVAGAFHLTC